MKAVCRFSIAVAVIALSSTVGCKLKPVTPEIRHSLNRAAIEKNEDLASDQASIAQLGRSLGALGALLTFGGALLDHGDLHALIVNHAAAVRQWVG